MSQFDNFQFNTQQYNGGPDLNVFQDNSAFIDTVSVTPVREPSGLTLGGAVLAAIMASATVNRIRLTGRTRLRPSL
jgi:hypothetical protein